MTDYDHDPLDDELEAAQIVEVVVRLKIRCDADIQEVVSEMDYNFDHEDILDTEIVDLNTEI